MIYTCQKCGGLFADVLEAFAGKPCSCPLPQTEATVSAGTPAIARGTHEEGSGGGRVPPGSDISHIITDSLANALQSGLALAKGRCWDQWTQQDQPGPRFCRDAEAALAAYREATKP